MVEPGRRCLGDRYELHQLIASGGMGQVWRGTDVALHRSVAIKVLRSEYTGDPTFVARFRAEAQHAASMSHPNIAAVFDYGEEIAQDGIGWLPLASDPGALTDAIGGLLLHGTMSSQMRASVVKAVSAVAASNPLKRVRTAVYLVATSSQYQVAQ